MNETIQLPAEKASRRSAFYSALGLAILFGSLLYSYGQLRALEQRRAGLMKEISDLKTEKEKQENELQATIDKLVHEKETLYGPIQNAAKALVSAVPIRNLESTHGEQFYYFLLWIKIPESRKVEISRVEYHYNDPTHFNQIETSREGSNGYAITYRGKSCDAALVIDIVLENKQSITLPFDMCAALGKTPNS